MVFTVILASLAIPASAAENSCDELLQKSEDLWLKLDYEGSDRALDQAKELCPERAEIYWRMARNEYARLENIPRDKKPGKDELTMRYRGIEALAKKCIGLDPEDGNCWLWKAVGRGRRGTTQSAHKTLFEVDDLEKEILKALELKPDYRVANGKANSMGDLDSMLGQFYRALPEWTCSFLFKQIVGTCGDLDKSIEYHRKAIAREPGRIEYQKELAISLLCRGQNRNKLADIEEARKILKDLQSLPEIVPTDTIDKEHAKILLENPSLACGYSRDAQQEQSKKVFKKIIK